MMGCFINTRKTVFFVFFPFCQIEGDSSIHFFGSTVAAQFI
jgi:hypothetical protein